MLTKRNLLLAAPLFVVGCKTLGGTPLDQVKAYAAAILDGLMAAASQYEAAPSTTPDQRAMVQNIIAELQAQVNILNGAKPAESPQQIVSQILTGIQTLLPLLTPFIGPVAAYLPMAIGVLQAFVNNFNPPANAPPVPPAAMRSDEVMRRAAHYRAKHGI